jgi:hypothetical protein
VHDPTLDSKVDVASLLEFRERVDDLPNGQSHSLKQQAFWKASNRLSTANEQLRPKQHNIGSNIWSPYALAAGARRVAAIT